MIVIIAIILRLHIFKFNGVKYIEYLLLLFYIYFFIFFYICILWYYDHTSDISVVKMEF